MKKILIKTRISNIFAVAMTSFILCLTSGRSEIVVIEFTDKLNSYNDSISINHSGESKWKEISISEDPAKRFDLRFMVKIIPSEEVATFVKRDNFTIEKLTSEVEKKLNIKITTKGLGQNTFLSTKFWIKVLLNYYDSIGGRLVSYFQYAETDSFTKVTKRVQNYIFQIPNPPKKTSQKN